MLHILITDDHPIFVEGLESILRKSHLTIKTYHAHHIESAKRCLKSNPAIPLMLLDRTLPGVDSLNHIQDFQAINPLLRIAIISASDSTQHINEAFDAGAAGFIPKNLSVEQTLNAIEILIKGNIYLPKLTEKTYKLGKVANTLTQRQTEILSLAALGHSNKKIAQLLDLEEGTIKQHFNHIFKNLPADNRTHAIQIARTRGLIC